MNKSEAGKLGYEKSKHVLLKVSQQNKQTAIEKYEKMNKKCLYCDKKIPYEKRENKFCSQSCSASYNNLRRYKKTSVSKNIQKKKLNKKYCLNCNTELNKRQTKYCSNQCNVDYQWKEKKKLIESGADVYIRTAKKYLIERDGHSCSICGTQEWIGKPVPLVCDHIDGNPENNKIENFRLVCGNCDMQLPTYKGKILGMVEQIEDKGMLKGKAINV